jgi:hypothetical protein
MREIDGIIIHANENNILYPLANDIKQDYKHIW